MAVYSIKDLEKLSGIQAHTIRIWEKRYQLVKPMRTQTNIRVYTDEDLKRLLNVAILNNNGLKISKIARMSDNEVKTIILNLTDDFTNSESQIEALVMSMIEMNEAKFEKILSRLVLRTGFEEAVTKVMYPFLYKIGILWQTGNINPAQEHFITNLIRQKLYVAIDSVLMDEVPDRKRFLLFLPEGELHDIGLLYFNYLIKKDGHQVVYLGQSVPFKDLIEVDKVLPSEYLVTAFTTSVSNEMILEYLKALSASFHDHIIFVMGSQFNDHEINLKAFSNIRRLENQDTFKDFLNSLLPS
jgi:MerR family transcriptional regulator, light-induced transcriptional regulator